MCLSDRHLCRYSGNGQARVYLCACNQLKLKLQYMSTQAQALSDANYVKQWCTITILNSLYCVPVRVDLTFEVSKKLLTQCLRKSTAICKCSRGDEWTLISLVTTD